VTPLVAVAGAGPAGLTAATVAASHGAAVVLCDEGDEPGGQLLYKAQPADPAPGEHAAKPDRLASRLTAVAIAAGVELRRGALVAGMFPGRELLLVEGGRATRIVPDALIVATGSTDLPYPFAGATLPGVFTARALQLLINRHRVRPGRRFALIGGGAEAEELAVDIMLVGGDVVWSGIAPAPFLCASGAAGVAELSVGSESYPVDVITIAVGRQADAALAVMAGTPLAFSAALGGLVPVLDDRLRSGDQALYVAGDAAGPASVAMAVAEGRLAGVAAAAGLGLAGDEDVAAARAAGGPELAWRIALRGLLAALPAQPYA
jgi:sarcosine oxidase subunit alpha